MDAQVEGPAFSFEFYGISLDILQKNGWRTSSGKMVTNKDLFCKLDEVISSLEQCEIKVGFWRIDRQVCTNCMELFRGSP